VVIAFDVDGVLNDLHTPWVKLYNKLSGDTLKVESIFDYDIRKFVLPSWKNKILELLNTPGLFLHAPIAEGAVEVVKKLLDAGHEVIFVSAFNPFYQSAPEKGQWLEEHFSGIMTVGENIFFCSKKYLVKFDILIDDSPKNLELLSMKQMGILWNQPWNSLDYHVNRATTWQEVLDLIEGF